MEKGGQIPKQPERLRKDFLESGDFLFWKGELEATINDILGGYEMGQEEKKKLGKLGIPKSTELDIRPVLMKKVVELACKNGYDEAMAERFFWGLVGDALKENVFKDIENKFTKCMLGGDDYNEVEKLIKRELLEAIMRLSPSVYGRKSREGNLLGTAKIVLLDKFYEIYPDIKKELYRGMAGAELRRSTLVGAVAEGNQGGVAATGGTMLEDKERGGRPEEESQPGESPPYVRKPLGLAPDFRAIKPQMVFAVKNVADGDTMIIEIKERPYLNMKTGDYHAVVHINDEKLDRDIDLAEVGIAAYTGVEHKNAWSGRNKIVNWFYAGKPQL